MQASRKGGKSKALAAVRQDSNDCSSNQNKTINQHLIIAKTMASGDYRGLATLWSSKHHVIMRGDSN